MKEGFEGAGGACSSLSVGVAGGMIDCAAGAGEAAASESARSVSYVTFGEVGLYSGLFDRISLPGGSGALAPGYAG